VLVAVLLLDDDEVEVGVALDEELLLLLEELVDAAAAAWLAGTVLPPVMVAWNLQLLLLGAGCGLGTATP
jgi:hypothetical protein